MVRGAAVQNMLGRGSEEVAKFLAKTSGLEKAVIGEYLGEREETALAVMHAYVDAMDFAGLAFDEAIRRACCQSHPRLPLDPVAAELAAAACTRVGTGGRRLMWDSPSVRLTAGGQRMPACQQAVVFRSLGAAAPVRHLSVRHLSVRHRFAACPRQRALCPSGRGGGLQEVPGRVQAARGGAED